MPRMLGLLGQQLLYGSALAGPTMDLDFTTAAALDSRLTLARSSAGGYFDSTGTLQSAAANAPRFDYDPATARTNLIAGSALLAAWGGTAGTIAAAASATAPAGLASPFVLNENTTASEHFVQQGASPAAATTYTFSMYLRAEGRTKVNLRAVFSNGQLDSVVTYDLGAVSAAVVTNGLSLTGATIVPAGGGWYRCGVTLTTPGTLPTATLLLRAQTAGGIVAGLGAAAFDFCAPQFEPGSTATAYIPTSGSVVTVCNPRGLLIEEQRSNSIRNPRAEGAVAGTPGTMPTNWVLNPVSGISYQVVGSGTENGIPYVDLSVSGTNNSGATWFAALGFDTQTGISASPSQTWTASFYLRVLSGSTPGNVASFCQFYQNGSYITNQGGAFVASSGAPLGQNRLSATVTTVANTTSIFPYMAFSVNAGQSIAVTLRIGAPQCEQGSFATSVILPPAGAPAAATRAADTVSGGLGRWFNFGATRTNLMLNSGAIVWSSNATPNDTSATGGQAGAPDGSATATLLVPSSSNGSKLRYSGFSASNTVVQTYTASLYLKAAGYRYAGLSLENSGFGANARFAVFDLGAGTLAMQTAGGTATITSIGNGWYRCSVTATSLGTGGNLIMAVYPAASAVLPALSFAGDGTSGTLVWGAQVETGATMGAYIPTASASATLTDTGPGTLEVEGIYPAPGIAGAHNEAAWELSLNGDNRMLLRYDVGTNGPRFFALGQGTRNISGGLTAGAVASGAIFKHATAFQPGNVSMCANAGAVSSTTADLPTGLTTLRLGSDLSGEFMCGWIRRVRYWPRALANTELQQVTT